MSGERCTKRKFLNGALPASTSENRKKKIALTQLADIEKALSAIADALPGSSFTLIKQMRHNDPGKIISYPPGAGAWVNDPVVIQRRLRCTLSSTQGGAARNMLQAVPEQDWSHADDVTVKAIVLALLWSHAKACRLSSGSKRPFKHDYRDCHWGIGGGTAPTFWTDAINKPWQGCKVSDIVRNTSLQRSIVKAAQDQMGSLHLLSLQEAHAAALNEASAAERCVQTSSISEGKVGPEDNSSDEPGILPDRCKMDGEVNNVSRWFSFS